MFNLFKSILTDKIKNDIIENVKNKNQSFLYVKVEKLEENVQLKIEDASTEEVIFHSTISCSNSEKLLKETVQLVEDYDFVVLKGA